MKLREYYILPVDNFGQPIGYVETIQTNAFTIETIKENGAKINSWVWYKDINIKNNIITYKTGDIKIKILEV